MINHTNLVNHDGSFYFPITKNIEVKTMKIGTRSFYKKKKRLAQFGLYLVVSAKGSLTFEVTFREYETLSFYVLSASKDMHFVDTAYNV